MQLNTLKLGLLAAALTVGSGAFAQGSDSCATPQVLPGDGTHAFDNTAATTGLEGQACTYPIGTPIIENDVWFEWTATTTGTATFSTCGNTLDTRIAVFVDSGACPLPGQVALICNDDDCGLQSELDFAATAGTTYLLQLGSYSSFGSAVGTFDIFVTPPICSGPDDDLTTGDNDNCGQALPLPLGFNTGFQVLGAANAGGLDNDFWSITLAPLDQLDVTATFDGSVGNINLALFDTTAGCPGTFLIDSSLNPSDTETITYTNNGAAAQNLVLVVDAAGVLFDCNDYALDVAVTTLPANDDCATPALTGPSGVTYTFDNTLATTGTEGQDCGTISKDVWFLWTADFTGLAEFNTCGSTLDTEIAAYVYSNACPAPGVFIDCNDDDPNDCGGSFSLQSAIQFNVTTGTTYLLQIGHYSTFSPAGDSGVFTIFETTPPAPCTVDSLEPNDDCLSAIPLPQGLTTGLFVAGPGDPGGVDGDFFTVTLADGETLTVDLFFLTANGDVDLFFYDSTNPACGSGSTGDALAFGFTGSDNENVTWTNSTGADVTVIVHVDMFSFDGCNTYDMDVSGGSSVLGTPFCFGDGTDGVVCPCGNLPTPGSGEHCTHSALVGSFLVASGSPTVGADTLTLTIMQGEPNEAAIFISNTGNDGIGGGVPFGIYDGAICVTVDANLTRHFTNPATGVPIPTIMDGAGMGTNVIPLSDSDFNGLTVPGATIYYQAWMRSPAGPCGGLATFSAGVSILWN